MGARDKPHKHKDGNASIGPGDAPAPAVLPSHLGT